MVIWMYGRETSGRNLGQERGILDVEYNVTESDIHREHSNREQERKKARERIHERLVAACQ